MLQQVARKSKGSVPSFAPAKSARRRQRRCDGPAVGDLKPMDSARRRRAAIGSIAAMPEQRGCAARMRDGYETASTQWLEWKQGIARVDRRDGRVSCGRARSNATKSPSAQASPSQCTQSRASDSPSAGLDEAKRESARSGRHWLRPASTSRRPLACAATQDAPLSRPAPSRESARSGAHSTSDARATSLRKPRTALAWRLGRGGPSARSERAAQARRRRAWPANQPQLRCLVRAPSRCVAKPCRGASAPAVRVLAGVIAGWQLLLFIAAFSARLATVVTRAL